ncbi:hypothetical protein IWX78_000011 [Mycetocola sp. CAN_C7]|uniref:hypothetical protein n=1 Tax=Mycetocola sp. CAN_C7 TaxID=2787724 RepID=UPI0018C9CCDB
MRIVGVSLVLAAALLLSACTTTIAVPGPTVTATATAAPLEPRGSDTAIDALDAYALCAARIHHPPLQGRYTATITPFGGATIERTDEYGWYVLFKRTDTSPDAADGGLGTEAWGRCALDGTLADVTWFAGGYCSGPKPDDDLSDLSAIELFTATDPRAPACPTEE